MEKPFVIRWNIIGFAGGGAFFLSFLLGVFSGNPFLAILLRASLFGIVFALLGGGMAFVIERFIPEIAGARSETAAAPAKGKNVDIMISDGAMPEEQGIEELELDENGAGAGTGAAEQSAPAGEPREERASPLTDTRLEEDEQISAEDNGAEAALLDEDDQGSEQEARDADGGGVIRDLPGRAEAYQGGAPAKTSEGAAGGEPDLDVLPDMSHFESSFSPVTSGGMVNDTETYDGLDSGSLKRKSLNEDPATYVKAVRTFIKRDEGKRK